MCGIFGVIAKNDSEYTATFLGKSLRMLAKLSESRGKDSAGLCLLNRKEQKIEVLKGPIPITKLLKREGMDKKIDQAFTKVQNNLSGIGSYAFGHARLVTNGTQLEDENNQPVVKDGIVGVHNGIVVNVDELWESNTNIERKYEIDTEVLLSLVRNNLNLGKSLPYSISSATNKVFGTVATAMIFNDLNKFALCTNNGSLYIIHNSKDILFFASERFLLKELETKMNLHQNIGECKFFQLKANSYCTIDLENFTINTNPLLVKEESANEEKIQPSPLPIEVINYPSGKAQLSTVLDINKMHLHPKAIEEQKLLIYPEDKIKTLKRCTKCILPETFPYIEFDEKGVCNYCHNHTPLKQPKDLSELRKLVEPYRRNDGEADVLVPFSGGRDSTYSLHIIKKELGLNPIAFTYDWGMVTDLARRNIARVCGKLGVENIIVAADIHWKRENVRKNITAWLKRPALGMIPLFMAGDKFFFYYTNVVKKQTNVDLNIWGINDLENTDFKVGFAGLAPKFNKKRIYSLSLISQIKLFGFIGKNFITSPGYFNQSNLDTLGSFFSRYISPKSDYYHMFDYIRWDEKELNDLLVKEYDWETAMDTNSTWRIGDGTASFYNYIYTLVAGFSENDTFRSNQIRNGMITREKALSKIYEENLPRYNSLKWYLEIIGLSFEDTIKTINSIPRMYK